MLGRIHTAAEARQAVRFARNAGFDNLNLDLIYGLPARPEAIGNIRLSSRWRLEPEHLSLYALTLEEDTPMQQMIDKGESAGYRPGFERRPV